MQMTLFLKIVGHSVVTVQGGCTMLAACTGRKERKEALHLCEMQCCEGYLIILARNNIIANVLFWPIIILCNFYYCQVYIVDY